MENESRGRVLNSCSGSLARRSIINQAADLNNWLPTDSLFFRGIPALTHLGCDASQARPEQKHRAALGGSPTCFSLRPLVDSLEVTCVNQS